MNLLNTKAAAYAAAILAGGAVLYLVGRKLLPAAGEAAVAVGQAVNPVNPNNVFASGVNAVGGALTDQGEAFSLGSWFYDLTHDDYDPNAPAAPADEATWFGNLRERIGL